MRAKKTTKSSKTKPARSVRYLLSADRKLQKLSLKKMSEGRKSVKQAPRAIQPKNSPLAPPSASQWGLGWPAVVVGVICVIGAAALIGAPQPTPRGELGPAAPNASVDTELTPVRLDTKKAATAKPPATSPSPAPRTASTETSTARPHATEKVKAPLAVESAAKPPAVASAATAPAVEPVHNAGVQNVAPVTITGCLQGDGDTFWLKDTSGAEAPKARSWKTGFLTKRTSRVELVDAANALTLRHHVGQRVAATGVLTDREMRARSLRQIAASCN